MKCPQCNSTSLARKYAAFWAPVGEDGEDLAQNFDDHKSSTELTDECQCGSCGFGWECDL